MLYVVFLILIYKELFSKPGMNETAAAINEISEKIPQIRYYIHANTFLYLF